MNIGTRMAPASYDEITRAQALTLLACGHANSKGIVELGIPQSTLSSWRTRAISRGWGGKPTDPLRKEHLTGGPPASQQTSPTGLSPQRKSKKRNNMDDVESTPKKALKHNVTVKEDDVKAELKMEHAETGKLESDDTQWA